MAKRTTKQNGHKLSDLIIEYAIDTADIMSVYQLIKQCKKNGIKVVV